MTGDSAIDGGASAVRISRLIPSLDTEGNWARIHVADDNTASSETTGGPVKQIPRVGQQCVRAQHVLADRQMRETAAGG